MIDREGLDDLHRDLAQEIAYYLGARHQEFAGDVDLSEMASHLGWSTLGPLRDRLTLEDQQILDEQFPPPCENGCPGGWAGLHKFSCSKGW